MTQSQIDAYSWHGIQGIALAREEAANGRVTGIGQKVEQLMRFCWFFSCVLAWSGIRGTWDLTWRSIQGVCWRSKGYGGLLTSCRWRGRALESGTEAGKNLQLTLHQLFMNMMQGNAEPQQSMHQCRGCIKFRRQCKFLGDSSSKAHAFMTRTLVRAQTYSVWVNE